MQESKLRQLSVDLKSELTSGSLTEFKQMVSDFMQELKDSMSRQTQMPVQMVHPTPGSSNTSPPRHSSSPTPLGLPAQPIPQLALSDLTQSPHTAEGPASHMLPVLGSSKTYAPSNSVIGEDGFKQDALSNITPQTDSMHIGESTLSEDDIELNLPESQATSVIEEEFGLAGSRAAESVAESVSDFQYSMTFEGSAQRSPASVYRSPAPGDSAITNYA